MFCVTITDVNPKVIADTNCWVFFMYLGNQNCRGIADANSKIIKRLRQLFAVAKMAEL